MIYLRFWLGLVLRALVRKPYKNNVVNKGCAYAYIVKLETSGAI